MNLYHSKYDKYRSWIQMCRAKDISWDMIKFGNSTSQEYLEKFLEQQKILNFWDVTLEEWFHLVESQKKSEEEEMDIVGNNSTIIVNEPVKDILESPSSPGSCWLKYKSKLISKGFRETAINSIEQSSIKILSQLKIKTEGNKPVKGLVVGQVQSGKTANMAGLISMAADYGWNMFIVLSGTIENLRLQTSKRLFEDLYDKHSNIEFNLLNDLSRRTKEPNRLQDLRVHNNKDKYLYVCLKNSTRLKNLNGWLNKDPKSKKHLKILLIDDEADQAGINTLNIEEEDRRVINQQIINLVFNKNIKGVLNKENYGSMNYIGYTATPYANILNESSSESLYPHNFISTLATSNEYFGPQQLFGVEGTQYDGLTVINDIRRNDIDEIEKIHKGKKSVLPDSLIDSLLWFLCCVAVARFWKRKEPISMLVHTSQRQEHHNKIANQISNFLIQTAHESILKKCKAIYKVQTEMFNKQKLRVQYPRYEIMDDEINDFPSFDEITVEIENLLKQSINHILLEENGEMTFSNGIHLCIDNCGNNYVKDDGSYLRLVYPKKDSCNIISPAFIVIGGATLSRGLTIEGLVSTYFLRTVKQADTLMQMGRWFGYRRGYETLPRIWLSEQTRKQFEFLSLLDFELRKEIFDMEQNEISPSKYGPKVLMHPKASFLMVTSKPKMQSTEIVDVDYTGSSHQTVVFYEDTNILRQNIDATVTFVEQLGKDQNRNPSSINCKVFRNIESSKVTSYLEKLLYPSGSYIFSDLTSLIEWINLMDNEGKISKWNVILAGLINGDPFKFKNVSINKVTRTRRVSTLNNGTLNIGVLRGPNDEYADLDLENANDDMIARFKNRHKTKENLRELFGVESTPQLFIYIIDKNSKVSQNEKQKNREDLNVGEDLVGVWINMPRGDKTKNYNAKLRIKLNEKIDIGDVSE